MSKMMIVAATSEKMLELMDKITIEEGVISFLASNKATAKGYPCMFSVEGKTTTASVKFEAKIKGLDEKGEMMPVEKISVYLPARFAGSVRAVAEQTDIVYMQFEEKQVTLLSQKPAIQIPVGFVEEPTKVKNPKTDAFSMSIPLEKISQYLPHMATTKSGIGFLPVLSGEGPILKMASTDRQNTMLTVDLSPTMVRFESKDRSEVKEEDYKPYVDAISTYLTIQPGTLIRILACNKSYNQLGISFQFDEEHKNIIGIALKWPDAIYQLRLNIQSAVDKRMYEAAFRNTETVQYEFQANSNSLRRALSVMNAGAQKVDTVKVSFEGQMMSISNYSDSQLNFFEISDEYEYNRATGEEIPTLYLEEKIVDMTNILMVLATSFTTNGMVGEFEPTEYSRIKSIISKNVRKIYADCGLRDKDAASLYETVPASGGSFGSGRRKKRLPQMHDFYRAILLDARENKDSFKENAFSLLLDIFEDRVREMYYCPHCMKEFTREELSTLKRTERGAHVCNNHEEGKIYYLREIHGSQAYLDCQSTLSIDMSLPFHNFDLSQITDETERINMIMVVQSYIEENFIKKNSTNPNKARKLIVSTDEAHRILKFEGARMFENALYRVARKRHTAPWLILQSVKDFAKYQDTEEILKSTETFMLFRHNYLDGQYIKDTTNLTQSQVDTVLNLGGTSEAKKYGELCLVDIPTKRAVFIQADYLKDSEFDVVETDVEKIAEHARMKQGA